MSIASELRLTNADLEAMPEDGNRYEVIDGELFISGPPTYIHQATLVNIIMGFEPWLREHPFGRVLPGVGVIFDDYTGVIPDLIFISNERLRKTLREGRFHGAPEVIIETLTPGASNGRRDLNVKRSLYDSRGVTEYWLVDPENQIVELHLRNHAGELVFDRSVLEADELTCGVLPGFSVRVDTLFV